MIIMNCKLSHYHYLDCMHQYAVFVCRGYSPKRCSADTLAAALAMQQQHQRNRVSFTRDEDDGFLPEHPITYELKLVWPAIQQHLHEAAV